MSQTVTTNTIRVGVIDSNTEHMYTEDNVATFCVTQSDRLDPPQPFPGRGFPIQQPRGLPRGGFLGGGGGGGNPLGGHLPNVLPQQANPGGGSKLVGNPPIIFDGDCHKCEAFMLNWKKYQRANRTTPQMMVPYNRAMLFLTYIQGGNTTEWADHLGEWLNQQILNNKVDPNNPWLWDSVVLAFNHQYTDKLTQE